VPFLVLVFAAFGPPLILIHELGHALAALALTRGHVRVTVGVGPAAALLRQDRLEVRAALIPAFGVCEYDPWTLQRPRAEAWIALAGPAASLAACVLLLATAMLLRGPRAPSRSWAPSSRPLTCC
jgi:membrane-associated protease RseP (regulator of RpoE activity)